MNSRAVSLAITLSALSLPASAVAATDSGTVLSVDRVTHVVQIVDAGHVVHAYGYGKTMRLRDRIRIRFRVSGNRITLVKNLGRASVVSFDATVVSSGAHALVIRLSDGNDLTIDGKRLAHAKVSAPSAKRLTPAGTVAITVQALQPGETVLVTERTAASGSVTTLIELTGGTGGGPASEERVTGVVTDIESNTFQVTTGSGSVLTLRMAQATLANLNLNYCDQVTASYHQDAGVLVADSVNDSGPSSAGICAGDGSSGSEEEASGAITRVSASAITIDQGPGVGPLTFTVDDPSITEGFGIGDVVDVTYSEDTNGTLDASDVEYVEDDSTGVVIAVSAGSLTITDDLTGLPDLFAADPSDDMFDGILVGDEVDVSYHPSLGAEIVDSVADSGPSS